MKKKLLSLFCLALLFSFTLVAQSQKPLPHFLQHELLGHTMISPLVHEGSILSSFRDLHDDDMIAHGASRDLGPVYDSIYHWDFSDSLMGWDVKTKEIGLVYDENNNLLESTTYTFDGTWTPTVKHLNTYESQGHLLIEATLIWNGSAFIKNEQYIRQYDANGNLISILRQIGQDDAWINAHIASYTYDEMNLMTELFTMSWIDQEWVNEYKEVTAHNETGLTESIDSFEWINGEWVHAHSTTYSYEVNMIQVERITQNWNGTQLENNYREVRIFSLDQKLLSATYSQWAVNSWLNTLKWTYTYNNIGYTTNVKKQFWSVFGWINEWQSIAEFDLNDSYTGQIEQLWIDNEWMNDARSVTSYNEAEQLSHLEHFKWMNNDWIISSEMYEATNEDGFIAATSGMFYYENSEPELAGDSTHFYFHIPTAVVELDGKLEEIVIYPNPTDERLNIVSDAFLISVEILDMSGRKVYSNSNLKKQRSFQFSFDNECAGLYLVHVETEKGSVMKRVAVR